MICAKGIAQKTKVEFYAMPLGTFFSSFLASWLNPEAGELERVPQAAPQWEFILWPVGGGWPAMLHHHIAPQVSFLVGFLCRFLCLQRWGVLRGLSACPLVVIYSCFHLTHGSFTELFSNNLILKWCKMGEKGKARSSCMLKNESQWLTGWKPGIGLFTPQHAA